MSLKDWKICWKIRTTVQTVWLTKEQKNDTKASLISLTKIRKIHCLELETFRLEVTYHREGNWPLEKTYWRLQWTFSEQKIWNRDQFPIWLSCTIGIDTEINLGDSCRCVMKAVTLDNQQIPSNINIFQSKMWNGHVILLRWSATRT